MPQFLVTTPASSAYALDVNGRTLSSSHEQIIGILRSRLGANHADLLAKPKLEPDGSISWSTALAGPIVRAADLPADARQKLEQRATRISSEIRGLAQQFMSEQAAASQLVAQTLERTLIQPPGDWLFSVDGKPVRVLWGHSDTPLPAAATAPPAPPGAISTPPVGAPAAIAQMAVPPGTGVPPQPVAAGGLAQKLDWRPLLPWLCLVLLAAALAWAMLHFAPPASDGGLAEQIAATDARNKELEDELAKKTGSALRCVPEPAALAASAPASAPEPAASAAVPETPPSAPLPEPKPSPPPPPPPPKPASAPASAAPPTPAPPPNPMDALKKRVADAGQDCDKLSALLQNESMLKRAEGEALALKTQMMQSMQQNCREKAVQEARNSCPGQRPPELAPEMALVFDASGSMDFSLDMTPEEMRQAREAENVQRFANGLAALFGVPGSNRSNPAVERLYREPKRITTARQSAIDMAKRLPSDMGVSLVLVDECPSAEPAGTYSPARRGELISRIESIKPNEGTPLADGVRKAGGMVDGTTREAIMVVVSDGQESCGGDPCAVAAALKRAKPFLKINVVDITGTGAGNCLAQITGGKVFTAGNAQEVAAMTERAAQDAMPPSSCKP